MPASFKDTKYLSSRNHIEVSHLVWELQSSCVKLTNRTTFTSDGKCFVLLRKNAIKVTLIFKEAAFYAKVSLTRKILVTTGLWKRLLVVPCRDRTFSLLSPIGQLDPNLVFHSMASMTSRCCSSRWGLKPLRKPIVVLHYLNQLN